MVEERQQPRDSNKTEQQWYGNPEDQPLSFAGSIRGAISFRIANLLHEIKLPEGKPEKH
jgi:hypothetical protein